MVDLEPLESTEDIGELLELLKLHQAYTGSEIAEQLLEEWSTQVCQEFVKVMPLDYKRVRRERAAHDEEIESRIHAEHASL